MLNALNVEKNVMIFILSLFVVVTVFAIFAGLTMMINDKYKSIEEVLTNYFTICNLLLKNCDIIYNNIKNNLFTCLDKDKFINNKKVIFREILIFTKNL